MLTTKRKNRWIGLIIAVLLSLGAAGCSRFQIGTKTGDSTGEAIGIEETEDMESAETQPVVPEQWHIFEYNGVKYDLWEIYSELQGVSEWGRISKYVVAKGYVNKDNTLFVLINTETQTIEHHFIGTVFTYHSDDINTIVYARYNTICSFDGTLFVDLVLGADEYIRALKYTEDKTQIIVTIETPDSTQTKTIDLKPVGDNAVIENNEDELALRYKAFSGIVSFAPSDGSVWAEHSEELAVATDAYFSEYGNDMSSRPPLVYYLVQKMELSKSEMYDLYCPDVPPDFVDYLFIEDMEEAKHALMTDYSFYADGNAHTFYEVFNAEKLGKPPFDITKTEYAVTWWNINDYLEFQQTYSQQYGEYIPYVEKIIKENFTTITDIADWETLGLRKEHNATYPFLWNLLSGESEFPEYNGLGIKDYSLTRIFEQNSVGTKIEFTFTVTGNSLPETLPPGTYTKIVNETVDIYLRDNIEPETKELNIFGDNPAVHAVDAYLTMVSWELSPFGEWDITNGILPSNYICKFYGDENMTIRFDEMQRLLSEKFGITIDEPTKDGWFHRCEYNKATNTVRYADTRGYEAAHRIIDFNAVDGTAYVTVQLFADRQYLIPSHKVVYRIGADEVFLDCEIIETGNYEPQELS